MSELITVKRGFTLEETPPIALHHSQTDSVTSVTRSMKYPIAPDSHTPGYVSWYPYGYFADRLESGQWVEGKQFGLYTDSAHTISVGVESYDMPMSMRFWSWDDNQYHTIYCSKTYDDPNNDQIKGYTISDSVLGVLYPQFICNIGIAPFSMHYPKIWFDTGSVICMGHSGTSRGFEYIVTDFDIGITYCTGHSSPAEYDVTVSKAYQYTGIKAACCPVSLGQSEQSHVVTETITIDS